MLKERYCDMFDKVKADERLIADTLHAAKGGRKKITVKWMGVAAHGNFFSKKIVNCLFHKKQKYGKIEERA